MGAKERFRKTSNVELERVSISRFKKTDKLPVIIVLEDIRSMLNVGSVFRTADAFIIEKIYLTGITAKPSHREIHKTALGATESVAWEYQKEAIRVIDEVREQGYQIISVEQAEPHVKLSDFAAKPSEKYCLVFGNEVTGVSNEVVQTSDMCLEIPQFGTKHSLNISVSVGVVVWKLFETMLLEN